MTSRWVLLTGLVRSPEGMRDRLDRIADWRAKGLLDGAVFSSWAGELDGYPEVAARMAELGMTLVESDPPPIRSDGHVLHQMITLRHGLLALPPGAVVIKSRSDLGGLDGALEAVLEHGLPETDPPPGWPAVFRRRVVVAGSFMFVPLYINDIQFAGLREDLLKLVNCDLSMELFTTGVGPEQWFHTAPFRAHFPLLDRFLTLHPGLIFGQPDTSRALCEAMLHEPLGRAILVTCHSILAAYYAFAQDIAQPPPQLREAGLDALFQDGALPGLFVPEGAHHPCQTSIAPSLALLDGRIRFGGQPAIGVGDLSLGRDPAFHARFAAHAPEPGLEALAARFQDIIGWPLNRLPREEEAHGMRRLRFTGPPARLSGMS